MKAGNQLFQPALAWVAILSLIIVTALGIVAGAGSIIRLLYPAGAFGVALLLYFRYPVLYLGFSWWIFFLSPFVRRLVDYKSGWTDPSTILLAPPLVILVCSITLLKHLPKTHRNGSLCFVVSIAGTCYTFLVGLINNSISSTILDFLGWVTPILFGFHLFVNWRYYPEFRSNIQRTFLWGLLLTSIYGIVQFLVAPQWDRYWMLNAPINSIGSPLPLQIRVFSTLNAPGSFAVVVMAGLLLMMTYRTPLSFPASIVGYIAFLLSQVRASWLGWLTGLLILIPSLTSFLQIRLLIVILSIGICVVPLATMEPFSEVVVARVQSLSSKGEDRSYSDRMAGYQNLFQEAFTEVIGKGFGYKIEDSKIGANDSGILSILLSFGWLGTIPYFGGILLVIQAAFSASTKKLDPFISTALSIGMGVFVQIGLGVATAGLSGNLFWGFLALSMAGEKFHRMHPVHQREYIRPEEYILSEK